MSKNPDIHEWITHVLESSLGYEYAKNIAYDEEFSEDVANMVDSLHGTVKRGKTYDVREAIGRVLMYRLGIWY